jgi:PEGA domain-containing protein
VLSPVNNYPRLRNLAFPHNYSWHFGNTPAIRSTRELARLLLSVSMARRYQMKKHFCPIARQVLRLSLLFCMGCGVVSAQSTVEAAGTTSVAAAAASGAKPAGWASVTLPDNKGKSSHLAASSGPPADAANRQALEQRAGQNPSKLLIRSVPTAAQVWIDGKFVGNSPMLLVLAPGKYRLELRGQRMEYASQVVDLLPKETREVALKLVVRYPTRASFR